MKCFFEAVRGFNYILLLFWKWKASKESVQSCTNNTDISFLKC